MLCLHLIYIHSMPWNEFYDLKQKKIYVYEKSCQFLCFLQFVCFNDIFMNDEKYFLFLLCLFFPFKLCIVFLFEIRSIFHWWKLITNLVHFVQLLIVAKYVNHSYWQKLELVLVVTSFDYSKLDFVVLQLVHQYLHQMVVVHRNSI